jgi:hypothetical protein
MLETCGESSKIRALGVAAGGAAITAFYASAEVIAMKADTDLGVLVSVYAVPLGAISLSSAIRNWNVFHHLREQESAQITVDSGI